MRFNWKRVVCKYHQWPSENLLCVFYLALQETRTLRTYARLNSIWIFEELEFELIFLFFTDLENEFKNKLQNQIIVRMDYKTIKNQVVVLTGAAKSRQNFRWNGAVKRWSHVVLFCRSLKSKTRLRLLSDVSRLHEKAFQLSLNCMYLLV